MLARLGQSILNRLNKFNAAFLLLVFGTLILASGFTYVYEDEARNIKQFVEDLYANGGAELWSIAITVFVIEFLNDRRSRLERLEREEQARLEEIEREQQIKSEAEAQEKADLVLQMGSPNNAFAREAVRKLRARGWLQDGTICGADLSGANLQNANLKEANLRGVRLKKANLRGAVLTEVNLEAAWLTECRLEAANLFNANLNGIRNIETVLCKETTILPDGVSWESGTDLRCFTDELHPEFWRPSIDPRHKFAPAWWREKHRSSQ